LLIQKNRRFPGGFLLDENGLIYITSFGLTLSLSKGQGRCTVPAKTPILRQAQDEVLLMVLAIATLPYAAQNPLTR
jgi:hypothetical protein